MLGRVPYWTTVVLLVAVGVVLCQADDASSKSFVLNMLAADGSSDQPFAMKAGEASPPRLPADVSLEEHRSQGTRGWGDILANLQKVVPTSVQGLTAALPVDGLKKGLSSLPSTAALTGGLTALTGGLTAGSNSLASTAASKSGQSMPKKDQDHPVETKAEDLTDDAEIDAAARNEKFNEMIEVLGTIDSPSAEKLKSLLEKAVRRSIHVDESVQESSSVATHGDESNIKQICKDAPASCVAEEAQAIVETQEAELMAHIRKATKEFEEEQRASTPDMLDLSEASSSDALKLREALNNAEESLDDDSVGDAALKNALDLAIGSHSDVVDAASKSTIGLEESHDNKEHTAEVVPTGVRKEEEGLEKLDTALSDFTDPSDSINGDSKPIHSDGEDSSSPSGDTSVHVPTDPKKAELGGGIEESENGHGGVKVTATKSRNHISTGAGGSVTVTATKSADDDTPPSTGDGSSVTKLDGAGGSVTVTATKSAKGDILHGDGDVSDPSDTGGVTVSAEKESKATLESKDRQIDSAGKASHVTSEKVSESGPVVSEKCINECLGDSDKHQCQLDCMEREGKAQVKEETEDHPISAGTANDMLSRSPSEFSHGKTGPKETSGDGSEEHTGGGDEESADKPKSKETGNEREEEHSSTDPKISAASGTANDMLATSDAKDDDKGWKEHGDQHDGADVPKHEGSADTKGEHGGKSKGHDPSGSAGKAEEEPSTGIVLTKGGNVDGKVSAESDSKDLDKVEEEDSDIPTPEPHKCDMHKSLHKYDAKKICGGIVRTICGVICKGTDCRTETKHPMAVRFDGSCMQVDCSHNSESHSFALTIAGTDKMTCNGLSTDFESYLPHCHVGGKRCNHLAKFLGLMDAKILWYSMVCHAYNDEDSAKGLLEYCKDSVKKVGPSLIEMEESVSHLRRGFGW